jgi:DNA polymerase-3 subunit delta'
VSFSNIVGHTKLIASLKKALRTGRLAHAYLFVGPQGVGKTTTALEFAKALQCSSSRDEACEQCSACRKVRDMAHPDVIWLEPQGRQILVDQVRELQRRLMYKPLEGSCRVAILKDAQDLNLQAANALLKTLEEPPADTVMVLLADSESSLLPTVVSRCQKVRFGPLATEMVSGYLQERAGWDPETAAKAARAAQGSIGKALLLKEEPVGLWEEEAREVLLSIQRSSALEVLERARLWASSRQEALARLEAMRSVTRDLLLEEIGSNPVEPACTPFPGQGRTKWLLDVWEVTGKALEALEHNINPQLLLEDLLAGIKERLAQPQGAAGRARKAG